MKSRRGAADGAGAAGRGGRSSGRLASGERRGGAAMQSGRRSPLPPVEWSTLVKSRGAWRPASTGGAEGGAGGGAAAGDSVMAGRG